MSSSRRYLSVGLMCPLSAMKETEFNPRRLRQRQRHFILPDKIDPLAAAKV